MKKRPLLLLLLLVVFFAWEMAWPWGRGHAAAWELCHSLLRPLGADRWFPVTEEIVLREGDGEKELAALTAVCRHRVDEGVPCRVEADEDGRTARVTVRMWVPDARKLLKEIRKAYEEGKGAQYLETERRIAETTGAVPDGTGTSGGLEWILPDRGRRSAPSRQALRSPGGVSELFVHFSGQVQAAQNAWKSRDKSVEFGFVSARRRDG